MEEKGKKSRDQVRNRCGLLLILSVFWILPISQAGATGSISGRVTGPDGSPVANLVVTAHHPCSNAQIKQARTDGDGRFTLPDLPPGDYKIWAHNSGVADTTDLVGELHRDALDFTSATPVTVLDGTDTAGIDFSLALGGSISGHVTDKAGLPLPNLIAFAYDFDNNIFRSSGGTDANGNYRIRGLPPGEHVVVTSGEHVVVAGSGGGDFAVQFYGGGIDPWSATPVKVVGGKDTPGINLALEPGGAISGRVVDASNGTPIRNLLVEVWGLEMYNSPGGFSGGTAGPTQRAITSSGASQRGSLSWSGPIPPPAGPNTPSSSTRGTPMPWRPRGSR